MWTVIDCYICLFFLDWFISVLVDSDWLTSLTIHYHTRLNLLVFGWLRYYAVINIDVQSLSFLHREPSSHLLLLLLTAKLLICWMLSDLRAHSSHLCHCVTVSILIPLTPRYQQTSKLFNSWNLTVCSRRFLPECLHFHWKSTFVSLSVFKLDV